MEYDATEISMRYIVYFIVFMFFIGVGVKYHVYIINILFGLMPV
jgi:hypothetical protein